MWNSGNEAFNAFARARIMCGLLCEEKWNFVLFRGIGIPSLCFSQSFSMALKASICWRLTSRIRGVLASHCTRRFLRCWFCNSRLRCLSCFNMVSNSRIWRLICATSCCQTSCVWTFFFLSHCYKCLKGIHKKGLPNFSAQQAWKTKLNEKPTTIM